MSKRPLDIENKENEEPNSAKKAKMIDTENIQIQKPASSIDEEEQEQPRPIASVIESNEGTIHPTNKQYIVYENTEPTMVSNTARFWSRKYLKVLRHVNPDVYDVCFEFIQLKFFN
jgi:hypothetical protein